MGCNFSTHNRNLPHSPKVKPTKSADFSNSETPSSLFPSPLESPQAQHRPRMTFGPSHSLHLSSPNAIGTIEIVKAEHPLGETGSSPLLIKGLVQMTMNSNDSKERSESLDGTPGLDRSLKKDFTFFGQLQSVGSSYEVNPKQTDRFTTSHRPSAFFGEKRMSSGNVLKLSTFASPQLEPLHYEQTEVPKKGPLKSLTASLLMAEQDIHPDTPGFKPSPSKLTSQVVLENNGSPGLRASPLLSGEIRSVGEEDQIGSNGSASLKLFPKTVQIVQQEQEGRLQSPTMTESHIKSWPHSPEQTSPTDKDGKPKGSRQIKLKKVFTQNLLDLITVKKPDSPSPGLVKKEVTESTGSPSLAAKKMSTDMAYDELSLSLSAVPQSSEQQRMRGSGDRNNWEYIERGQIRRTSKKLSTLKLQNLEFLNNGEMISPINNMQKFGSPVGYVSSPFSHIASFSKNVFEASEFMDGTMTNAENISRIDLDKYSFVAEVKEIEVDEHDVSIIKHQPIKKSLFNEKRVETRESRESPSIVLEDEDPQPAKQTALPNKPTRPVKFHKQTSLMIETPTSPPINPKKLLKNKTYHDMGDAERDASIGKHSNASSPYLSEPSLLKRKGKASSIQVIETMILDKSIDENGFKKINDYTLSHELGSGNFAKVKLGFDYKDGFKREYAIKIVSRKKLKRKLFTKQTNAYTQLQAEIAILKKMSHPNIVQLYEVIDAPDEDKLYLIMEYALKGAVMSKEFWKHEPAAQESDRENGSLFKKVRPLSEAKSKQYFRDLVLGIHYMHHYLNAVHRDIKPENLLIDEKDVLKIADFNISQMFEDSSNDIVQDDLGTKLYMAPETWLGSSFRGKPADIWAAGATLYYFLYGRPPFQEKFGKNIKDVILQNEPQFPKEKGIDQGAIELIKACLVKDPEKRITIEEIMMDEWITDEGTNPLSNEEFNSMDIATEEELNRAVTLKLQTVVMIRNQLVKSLSSARKNLQSLKEVE